MPQSLDLEILVADGGQIADGYARSRIAATLKMYGGRTVRFRIGAPKRTAKQNRFWWMYLDLIRRALIDSGEDGWLDRAAGCRALHRHFVEKHLGVETYEVFGAVATRPVSTRKLDRETFSTFIEAVRLDEDVLKLGVELPDVEAFEQREGRLRSYALAEPDYA